MGGVPRIKVLIPYTLGVISSSNSSILKSAYISKVPTDIHAVSKVPKLLTHSQKSL